MATFRSGPCTVGALLASAWVVALAATASGQTGVPPTEAPGGSTAEQAPAPSENAKKGGGPSKKKGFQLAPYLTLESELKLEYTFRGNADLDRSLADNLSLLEPTLSLDFSFDPHPSFHTFVGVELSREFALQEEGEREERPTKLEVEEAFILLRDVPIEGLAFQVGRQEFKDPREWLYDEELDAARIHYRAGPFSFEFSASRKDLFRRDLLRDNEEDERINNYHGVARYAITPEAGLAAYVLVRDDQSADQESPIFLGLQSSGEITRGLGYWLELAHVRGRDGSRKIRGFGLDVGLAYQFDLPLNPSLALGYAFGSGDKDPEDGTDRSFRQTGLQENEANSMG